MNRFVLGVVIAATGAAFLVTEAEARRLGGGRPVGAQRSLSAPPPAAVPARPMQQTQQAAPAQTQAAAPAAAQPQAASGMARWMPVLGGLALGGALGWLLGANGLAGLMVGILLAGLIVLAAAFAVRALARRAPLARPVQYAGLGSETVAAPPPSQIADFEPPAAGAARAHVPAGFDVAGFLRTAKLNFMRLQAANDNADLQELREFTTAELFEELRRDIEARGGARQRTDVMALNADLLEVTTEGDRHWASVRFSGVVRESPGATPEGFEEVWNLVKPADGSSGWLLAGIQQMH
ncbi:MAG: Tim44-like domain-containing protein [Pseudomonadota bacterium]